MDNDMLYGVEAIRKFLGIGHDKIIYLLHEEASFPAIRLGPGGIWMVRTADLYAWCEMVRALPGKTYRFR